jgi:hypothetical protein
LTKAIVPTSMTADQASQVIAAWASGAKYAEAMIAAGLTKKQAVALKADADWMMAYDNARSAFIANNLKSIQQHGAEDWKASAWLLERIAPERFAKRENVDVNVKVEALPWQSALNGQVIDAKAEVVKTEPLPEEPPSGG